mmetsp:Transcript_3737/g.10800  ORF Transcript_3737/g.10800 Transcript_3737/m.10800 type:complete len:134 (-) Transcript_3737:221-622(-)
MNHLRTCMNSVRPSHEHVSELCRWRSHAGAAASRQLATQSRHFGTGQTPERHPAGEEGPPPDPPGAFASMVAMASGAVGAVAVAAVGVVGVFKLALWIAGATGRSMTPDQQSSQSPQVVVVQPPQPPHGHQTR